MLLLSVIRCSVLWQVRSGQLPAVELIRLDPKQMATKEQLDKEMELREETWKDIMVCVWLCLCMSYSPAPCPRPPDVTASSRSQMLQRMLQISSNVASARGGHAHITRNRHAQLMSR